MFDFTQLLGLLTRVFQNAAPAVRNLSPAKRKARMDDAALIPNLIKLASSAASLDEAEEKASQALLVVETPAAAKELEDGCAATASALLCMAGVDVPMTLLALGLDELLQKRGWKVIPVGQQQAGDLGSTCYGGERHPGSDHIFTVCKVLNEQEMVVADNQRPFPHQRRTDGKDGKTPTNHFLRAV